MKRRVLLLASLFLIFLFAQTLQAQPRPPMLYPSKKEGKMKVKIKILRTWKLIEDLRLSEEQAVKFFPLLTEFDTKREELEAQKQQIMDELRVLLSGEKPSAKKIQQLLARLQKNEQELRSTRESFVKKTAAVLSTEQQARLILFEERFRRQLREVIQEMRHRGGGLVGGPIRSRELQEPAPPAELEMRLKKQIDRLQRGIQRLQRQIESLERRGG
ncbi:MAG: hypothetical protein B1H40_03840 [Candidatus Latescibacteria bacterium 4484_181]|nr:MAG: hypothetical protein B1H40_03840 [Candidatus Latescibacteria bacterium 4484_181]RKY67842.1 MAG: hypothetical protein DRQ02_06100 [Candidatus Latescibacterota bacterium]RKY71503.1 MAG: hypothetical protein DRQ24_07245 [Candidatus Latescibacterota bacterium]